MLDWSRIPKIDAHIHLMPPDVIAANQGFGDHFVDFGSVEDYQKLMARYQIEAAFIMPFNDPYMLSMDFRVRSVHENLLAMCSAGVGLYAFADADLRNDIDQTLHELERIAQEEKILGVKIHPSNTGYPVDGMYYDRIFGWAEANHILTEVHAYPRTHIADDVCSPLRLRTVLQRHPGLRCPLRISADFSMRRCMIWMRISIFLRSFRNWLGSMDLKRRTKFCADSGQTGWCSQRTTRTAAV